MKNILDSDLAKPSGCDVKGCPTDEELKKYPMLDEDDFDRVDEKLFGCERCKYREKQLSEISN